MTEAKSAGIDMRDRGFGDDPYGEYARLRAECPAHRIREFDGGISWLVTRFAAGRDAYADRRVSKDPMTIRDKLPPAHVADLANPLKRTLHNVDPPQHTKLRSVVGRAFTPRRIERLRPWIQRAADALLDQVASEDEVDLVASFAHPLPLAVTCELLGLPAEDRERFRSWFTPGAAPQAPQGQWGEAISYFTDLVARRRTTVRADVADDEQPDLVSILIAARGEGGKLTEPEIISTLTLLLIAGRESTLNLIAIGMLALLEHPDQLRLLRARPDLGPQAVEELLRYTNPQQRSSFLFTTQEIEVDGVTIPAGSRVSVGIASANRDPERFADADRLDITRTDNHHLAFGHGPHFCLGAPLARLQGLIALTTLVRRFPRISLACPPEAVRWRPYKVFQRGLASLPVRLRAAAPVE